MLQFMNTNIINNDVLNTLVSSSDNIFKSRRVYTGNRTLTAFRILAYWGLHHRDEIDDHVLFLESCAESLATDVDIYEAMVLLLSPTSPNFIQMGFSVDEAALLSARFTKADYVLTSDDLTYIMMWVGFHQKRTAKSLIKVFGIVNEVESRNGQLVDFKKFPKYL